jgi:hypothetical protein
MILYHFQCLYHSHMKLEEPHFIVSCLKNHLHPNPTYLMLSLIHQEVILTLNTSMQGMLPFEIDGQHVLSNYHCHLLFLNIKYSFYIFCPSIKNILWPQNENTVRTKDLKGILHARACNGYICGVEYNCCSIM